MKRFQTLIQWCLLVLVALIASETARCQTTPYSGLQSTTFGSVTTGATIRLIGSAVAWHQITWTVVSGAPAACQVQVDSSADGVNWNNADVIGSSACTANGQATAVSFVANFVRVNVTALSAASTVNVVWTGYVSNPAGGGGGLNPGNGYVPVRAAGAFINSAISNGGSGAAVYIDSSISPFGTNNATSGFINLPKNTNIACQRNAANTGDLCIAFDPSDRFNMNGFIFNFNGAAAGMRLQMLDTATIIAAEPGLPADPRTTATEAIIAANKGNAITFSFATAVTATAVQCGVGALDALWYAWVYNIGAGTVTLKATTSTINGVAGATGITLLTGQGGLLTCDGSAYHIPVSTASLAGGKIPGSQIADTAVTPAAYTNANITVDQQGRITAAANGTAATPVVKCAGSSISDQKTAAASGNFATTCTLTGMTWALGSKINLDITGIFASAPNPCTQGIIIKIGSINVFNQLVQTSSAASGDWQWHGAYVVSTLNGATSKVMGNGLLSYMGTTGGSVVQTTAQLTSVAEIASIDLSGNPVITVATTYGTCVGGVSNLTTIGAEVK